MRHCTGVRARALSGDALRALTLGPTVTGTTSSAVFEILSRPDWADTVVEPVPTGIDADASTWAKEIFSVRSSPRWVKGLLGLRQALVRLIGVRPAQAGVFAVTAVVGNEAIIDHDERHLRFVVGAGVDRERHLLWVTTAVRLHGRRGRLYFVPVRFLHDPVTRSMMRAAIRRLATG